MSLRILVVEDDPDKLRRILLALQKVEGCSLQHIDQARFAVEAKRFMHSTQYDLLILDIAIPQQADQLPSPHEGLAVLKEILARESQYHAPREVVGLTAYADFQESMATAFGEGIWQILLFDPTSELWAQQLQRKVEYIQLSKRSSPVEEYGIELGVVTALASPELEAALQLPWGWKRRAVPADPANYFEGKFLKGGNEKQVIATSAPRMGMPAACVAAMKLITAFRPKYLAMIGIAAGIEGRCNLGDVVIADPTWDWGSGKIVASGEDANLLIAPHQLGLDPFLRAKLSSFAMNASVADDIRRGWIGSDRRNVMSIHIGPVASGAAVLADSTFTRRLLQQHRKLLAVEMETYAVYAACHDSVLPQPKSFSMKGISDFADEKKNDDGQQYAAYTSAQALKRFVEEFI